MTSPGWTHLGGEVSLCLELLEEGGQQEGGEEEDDGPEENIWDVGSHMATGGALEFPTETLAHLEKQDRQRDFNWIFRLLLVLIISGGISES